MSGKSLISLLARSQATRGLKFTILVMAVFTMGTTSFPLDFLEALQISKTQTYYLTG